MKVTILGMGYVGLTSAACLLKEGHHVTGVDVNKSKVNALQAGKCPICEPGLEQLLRDGVESGRLTVSATVDEETLNETDITLVCVGTPSAPNGAHNLGFIAEVSRQIAEAFSRQGGKPLTVVYRSTVHPGTIEKIIAPIIKSAARPGTAKIDIVYNPEFLRESTAIRDYFSPPRIVIGTKDGLPNATMDALYASIDAPRFVTKWKESEITKLIDNSFHALKISFANEIGRICRQLDLDVETVHKVFVSDTKLNISKAYLRPGTAFGGSCLPKDVRALAYLSQQCDAHTFLIDSLIRSNEEHKRFMLGAATEGLEPGAKVLLNGVAFKRDSDDLRESPYVDLAVGLLEQGYQLRIHDPNVEVSAMVGHNLGFAYSHLPGLSDLMIDTEDAKNEPFDRVLDARGNADELGFQAASVVNVMKL